MFKRLKIYLPILILFFALLLLFSMFFNALILDGEPVMLGTKAIFGGSIGAIGSFVSADVNFGIENFIAFIIPSAIAITLAIYSMYHKKTTPIKMLISVLLVVFFVISIVFIVSMPENTTATISSFLGDTSFNYGATSLGIGPIIGLISSILGAISSILYTIVHFDH
jgi:hypothetical protein